MSYLKRYNQIRCSLEVKEVNISLHELKTPPKRQNIHAKTPKSPPKTDRKQPIIKLNLHRKSFSTSKCSSRSHSSNKYKDINAEPIRVELKLEDLSHSPSRLNDFLKNRKKQPSRSPSEHLGNDFIDPENESSLSHSYISINPAPDLLSSSLLESLGNISPIQEITKDVNITSLEQSFEFTFENSKKTRKMLKNQENNCEVIERVKELIEKSYSCNGKLSLIPKNDLNKIPESIIVWRNGDIRTYDVKHIQR
ncbi:unnamed protein product [Blepharisma stoltei]|uniref:Uncharacterized protein n=1 Tax=Blepharisma stoltei TaxID=1481888 RepID=A0AAU9JVY0_9CILI|nr:unnamed protein product [Blepharisma stoltei]